MHLVSRHTAVVVVPVAHVEFILLFFSTGVAAFQCFLSRHVNTKPNFGYFPIAIDIELEAAIA